MSSVTTKATAHAFQTDDPRLRPIHEKVLANARLDAGDVAALYGSKDILALGWLANYVRERRHGNATRFNVDSIVAAQADESLVVGDDLDRIYRAIEAAKKSSPQARVSALTVEELAARENAGEVIKNLRQAGADGLIGHSAELFLPALRKRLWHQNGTAEQRAEVRRRSLAAGLKVPLYIIQRNATSEQQAAELLSFREDAGDSFAALSFDPDATTSLHLPMTTGMQEMKQIAIARLALDNIAHIRAYWQMLGGKLIQIALRFGASDLDGTSLDPNENVEERKRELAREITVAGREPQEIPAVRKLVVLA